MMMPKIGLIAGHGVDAAAWREHTSLPEAFDWRIIQTGSEISPLDLSGLVWLWKPSQPAEQLNAERASLEQWVYSILRHRVNNLIPMVMAAVEPLNELDVDIREQALAWLKTVQKMLRPTRGM